MTIKELMERLKEFSEDIKVIGACGMEIEGVYEGIWIHTNYPYNKLDEKVVIIK